jgi:cysteinyl-tRNA synthetase
LGRFYTTLKAIQDEMKKPIVSPQKRVESSVIEDCRQAIESFQVRVEEAMNDDFNTAQALGYFYDLQRILNILLDVSKGRPTEEIILLLKKGREHFSKMGSIFGLFQEDPEKYLKELKKERLKRLNLSEEEILKFIEQRNAARKSKNWKRADEIRSDLLSKGIVLEDTSSGTIWKIK